MSQLSLFCGGSTQDRSFTTPLLAPLIAAINQASQIDITVSFIRQSGLRLLIPALEDAQQRGAIIRIITSDYLDVTEPVALRELMQFAERGAEVRIYESASNPGFHMKSYLFIHTATAEQLHGCAFVGSSNISRAALTESLEWNWCHQVNDRPDSPAAITLLQVRREFERLLDDPRVVALSHSWIDSYLQRYQISPLTGLRVLTGDHLSNAEQLRETPLPNEVQVEALAALAQSRQQGFVRGLVVMATGLGKTWLAAFDARQMDARRLLFVAHRDEIILQAQRTFIRMRPDAHTGLYNGSRQDQADWLFASVQTLGRDSHLRQFSPDHFDYIVVDEFHHASSPTYRRILDYFAPRFLLGLTATPERTDQADILALCDDNLIYEKGLRDAILARQLVPLIYHGILDEFINYDEIPWRNGKFDPQALETAFASHKRGQHALTHWLTLRQTRTLAFCISTRHADFMTQLFQKAGISAAAVYAGSAKRRNEALDELERGELQVIFSVDLFNEGTDLPAIDTVLMLRPTESRIVFLQQLGRGLRLHPDKKHLVVIDLVGNHKACLHKPYLLQSLLAATEGKRSSQDHPIALPDGCHINLDPKLLPLLSKLQRGQRLHVRDDYRSLKEELGYRPTAAQAFWAGFDFVKLRKQHGSWFGLIEQEGDLSDEALSVLANLRDFLLTGIETTVTTKSFKIILLQALLDLDGLRQQPTLRELARHSRQVIERHPEIAARDLGPKERALTADSDGWFRYWRDNPIKFSTTGNADSKASYWFEIRDEHFCPAFTLPEQQLEILHQMMQELIDLRLAQYRQQKQLTQPSPVASVPLVAAQTEAGTSAPQNLIRLRYYPNLKIACGHFKNGSADDVQWMTLDEQHSALDPERVFLANASGNSMNGGKDPILDGDLLLLEWIDPDHAGSLRNQIVAIQREDEAGDSQYLLRRIIKTDDGSYLLRANNPEYADLTADENMRTFARLKGRI